MQTVFSWKTSVKLKHLQSNQGNPLKKVEKIAKVMTTCIRYFINSVQFVFQSRWCDKQLVLTVTCNPYLSDTDKQAFGRISKNNCFINSRADCHILGFNQEFLRYTSFIHILHFYFYSTDTHCRIYFLTINDNFEF